MKNTFLGGQEEKYTLCKKVASAQNRSEPQTVQTFLHIIFCLDKQWQLSGTIHHLHYV